MNADTQKLALLFPGIVNSVVPAKESTLMGVGTSGGLKPSLVYLWQGEKLNTYPEEPWYLIPIGDIPKFWADAGSRYIVWDGMHPAIVGIAVSGNCKVVCYNYRTIMKILRRNIQGVTDANAEGDVFHMFNTMSNDDFQGHSPVVLYPKDIHPSELKPLEDTPEKLEGVFMKPPKLSDTEMVK